MRCVLSMRAAACLRAQGLEQRLPSCYPAPGGNGGVTAAPNVSLHSSAPLEKAAFNGLWLTGNAFYSFVVPVLTLHRCTPSEASSDVPPDFFLGRQNMGLNQLYLMVSLLLKRPSCFGGGFIAPCDLSLAKCTPVKVTGIWKHFRV